MGRLFFLKNGRPCIRKEDLCREEMEQGLWEKVRGQVEEKVDKAWGRGPEAVVEQVRDAA